MNRPFLTGRVDHTLDDKGRITLPAAFRDLFVGESYFVPSAHGEPFLRLYDSFSWAAHDQRYLDSLDELGDREADEQIGDLYEDMFIVSRDSQGRVTIPSDFIQKLGLKGKVRITGHRDHLRLWDPAVHQAYREARNRMKEAAERRRLAEVEDA